MSEARQAAAAGRPLRARGPHVAGVPSTTPARRPVPAPPAAAQPRRLEFVDRLRGLVIALMVLDHVREYFSADALLFQPTDLARTTPALFATRWVTHLCAPTFVLLAGVAAALQVAAQRARGGDARRDLRRVARFLATRGAWLVALEVTLVGFALDFRAPFLFLQVIWAIGVGLLLLAPLVRLPPAAVLALGALVVAGYAALPAQPGLAWRLLLAPGPIEPRPGAVLGFVGYPALPWAGVLWFGYGLGGVFARPEAARRRALLAGSLAALALFAALRLANGYGDPQPWAPQPRGPLYTTLSFLNVTKYPPSLQYVLLTLGCSLPIGLALERLRGPAGGAAARVLLAYGRTPLFTYLLHLYLVHGLAMLAGVVLGFRASDFVGFVSDSSRLRAAGWGVGLPAVYAVWLLVLAVLYPAARWYADYKARRGAWWLRYL